MLENDQKLLIGTTEVMEARWKSNISRQKEFGQRRSPRYAAAHLFQRTNPHWPRCARRYFQALALYLMRSAHASSWQPSIARLARLLTSHADGDYRNNRPTI